MNYGELLCLLKVLALNAPINCESNGLKLAVSSQLHTLIIRSFLSPMKQNRQLSPREISAAINQVIARL